MEFSNVRLSHLLAIFVVLNKIRSYLADDQLEEQLRKADCQAPINEIMITLFNLSEHAVVISNEYQERKDGKECKNVYKVFTEYNVTAKGQWPARICQHDDENIYLYIQYFCPPNQFSSVINGSFIWRCFLTEGTKSTMSPQKNMLIGAQHRCIKSPCGPPKLVPNAKPRHVSQLTRTLFRQYYECDEGYTLKHNYTQCDKGKDSDIGWNTPGILCSSNHFDNINKKLNDLKDTLTKNLTGSNDTIKYDGDDKISAIVRSNENLNIAMGILCAIIVVGFFVYFIISYGCEAIDEYKKKRKDVQYNTQHEREDKREKRRKMLLQLQMLRLQKLAEGKGEEAAELERQLIAESSSTRLLAHEAGLSDEPALAVVHPAEGKRGIPQNMGERRRNRQHLKQQRKLQQLRQQQQQQHPHDEATDGHGGVTGAQSTEEDSHIRKNLAAARSVLRPGGNLATARSVVRPGLLGMAKSNGLKGPHGHMPGPPLLRADKSRVPRLLQADPAKLANAKAQAVKASKRASKTQSANQETTIAGAVSTVG